ncbi:hypothetical protein, partial [Ottowia sp.]
QAQGERFEVELHRLFSDIATPSTNLKDIRSTALARALRQAQGERFEVELHRLFSDIQHRAQT